MGSAEIFINDIISGVYDGVIDVISGRIVDLLFSGSAA